MILTPEEQLERVLRESIEKCVEKPSDWVKSRILFGDDERDLIHSKELLENRQKIKETMGFDPIDSKTSMFLVSCLGRRLLQLPSIREILLTFKIKEFPEISYKLMKVLNSDSSTLLSILDANKRLNWRSGSSTAKKILNMLELPMSLVNSLKDDARPSLELISPYKVPPSLLDFQKNVKSDIQKIIEKNQRCLVIMPTGSGKTRTTIQSVVEFMMNSKGDANGIVWIADRDELCEQAAESFSSLLPFFVNEITPIWRYWSGRNIELSHDGKNSIFEGIVITSHQQLQRRLKEQDPIAEVIVQSSKVVIFDEAHRWLDWNESLIRRIEDYKIKCKIIGLTATPHRRESRENARLLQMFNRRLITPYKETLQDPGFTIRKLTDEGILAKRVDIKPEDIGCSFSFDSSPSTRLNESLRVIQELIKGDSISIIVFTENVTQSRHLSICLSMLGVSAEYLHSGTSPSNRRRIIERFRSGELTVLLNYMILTTGFDAPSIDTVLILREQNNENLPVIQQMIGRGLRGPKFGGTEFCKVIIR